MFFRLSKTAAELAGLVGFAALSCLVSLAGLAGSALAQEGPLPGQAVESKPAALADLEREEGVSVVFLGHKQGLDGWLLRKGDDLQTVYSTPDGQALVIGALYDGDGQPITAGQLETIPDLVFSQTGQSADLHDRLVAAHGPVFGQSGPLFHVFMDPRCPYCHALWQDAIPLISAGRMRLHVIPVAILGPASQQLSTQILAGDPVKNWQLAMQDRTRSLQAPNFADGQKRLEQNHALFAAWKGRGVPLLIFERNDDLLVMSGRPDSLDALLE